MAKGVIYKITNPIGQVYIGATSDYSKRLMAHRYVANNNKRRHLIGKSFSKYGFDNHIFTKIVELDNCSREFLYELEKHYIRLYCSFCDWGHNGLNLTIGGSGQKSINCNFKKVYAIDLNGKLVAEFNGLPAAEKFCNGDKRNISSSAKGLRPSAYGYIWTYDGSLSNIKNRYEKYLNDIRLHKEMIIHNSKIGSEKQMKKIMYINTGEIFESISSASKAIGIRKNSIWRIMNNKRNSIHKFKFI